MAYLLILNGQRVDESVELDPGATLTLGSSTGAHIQLPEPYVAEVHAQVYPAEGRYWFQDLGQGVTCHNADAVSGSIHELRPHDVISLGRTFLKFVLELPAALAEAVDVDGDVVEVEESAREAELEAELARLRAQIDARDSGRDAALAEQSQGLAQDAQRLERELGEAHEAASRAHAETTQVAGERDALSAQLTQTQAQLAQTQAQLAQTQAELTQAQAQLTQAQAQLGQPADSDLERELASALETLEAARGALAALGVADARRELARSAPTEPGALLDQADLAPELRARLDAGLAAHAEREALRRMAGAAPAFGRDERVEAIEAELRAARVKATDLSVELDMKGPA